MRLILNIFLRRSRKRNSKQSLLAYTIAESKNDETTEEFQNDFRKIDRIPVPTKNVEIEVDEDTGLIYVFNKERPWEAPWNVGTLIKNRFLLRASKKVYWY